jgi:hypothetical protein
MVSVIPPAIPNAIATPPAICLGDSSVLTSTTGYANPWPSGIDGTFNQANPAGWRIYDGNSGGYINFPANADNGVTNPWSESNGPKSFFQGTGYEVTYNNINPPGLSGKFAVSTGSVYTTMETPVFSTIGMASASLEFTQSFVLTAGSSARIEISVDGGNSYSSTPLMQWTGPLNVGTPLNSWVPLSINLNNYLGQPNLRIRFVSNFVNGPTLSTWALDGVGFPAAAPPVTYIWTPTGVGTGSPITVFPTTTTTYTLTSYIGSCYGGQDDVTVTVNPRASIAAANATPDICASPNAQTTSLAYNNAVNNPVTYSITWNTSPVNSFAAVNNASLPPGAITINVPANTAPGTYTGTISVANSFGCREPGTPFTITVNPRPAAVLPPNQTICNGQTATITLSVSGPGTISGTLTGGIPFSGTAPTISVNVSPTVTTTYSILSLTNGSCAALAADYAGSTTVNVNNLVSITAQPVSSKVCVGAALTLTAGYNNAASATWQISKDNGATWANITAATDGGIYTNFNSNTLNIAAVPVNTALSMIDYQYRLQVGSSCNNLQTDVVKLLYNYIWTGNVSIDWNNPNNWAAFEVPTLNCPDVYLLGNRSFEPTLSTGADGTVFNLHILTNADFTQLNGNMAGTPGIKLQVAGHIFKDPVSTYNAIDGTLEMNGSASQDIDALTFTNNALENLIVNSTGNLTLDGAVDIYESVTFGTRAVNLHTNGHLTLKSLAARTARLGTLNTGSQDVIGEATVERYLRPRMAWRFLAIPTSGGQTINQAWQEGATIPDANPKPGYGTQITGPVVANGIDAYTINPSMKAFNSNTYLWDGEANTHVPIEDRRGYMLFVRGDRSAIAPTCETCPQPTVMSTTLRTKGNFYKGIQPYNLAVANDWLSVGNPFASQVDLRLVAKSGGLVDAFTIWDSYPLGYYWVGAYQTLVFNGTNYINSSTGQVQNYIESGQAFFIQSDNVGAANFTIRETDKSDGSVNVSFAPPRTIKPEVTLWAKLVSAAEGQPVGVVDGLLLNFDNNYSSDIDKMDVKKFFSPGNNLSVLSRGYYLVAERMAYPNSTDSIQLILSSTSQQSYRLDFEPTNLEKLGVSPYLYDRYLDRYHPIAPTTSTSVPFTITTDPGSRAINRFKIIFKKPVSPELVITITEASRNSDRTIVVKWSATHGQDVEKYELERSADGRLFTGIITTPAEKTASLTLYSKTDIAPLAGDNYYRVKAIPKDGLLIFSETIKVVGERPGTAEPGTITVYPNPVSGKRIYIDFNEPEAGRYQVQLINALGQVAQHTVLSVDRYNTQHQVILKASVKPGQYQLSITAPNGSKNNQKLFIGH